MGFAWASACLRKPQESVSGPQLLLFLLPCCPGQGAVLEAPTWSLSCLAGAGFGLNWLQTLKCLLFYAVDAGYLSQQEESARTTIIQASNSTKFSPTSVSCSPCEVGQGWSVSPAPLSLWDSSTELKDISPKKPKLSSLKEFHVKILFCICMCFKYQ